MPPNNLHGDVPPYRLIAPISVASAFTETSVWLCLPLVALTLQAQDYTGTIAGLVSALPAAGVVAMALVLPAIVKRFGAVVTLHGGSLLLIVALASLIAAAHWNSLWMWAGGGFAVGLATAVRWILSDGFVNRLTHETTRGRALAFHETIRSMALGVGPLLVALAADDARSALLLAIGCAGMGALISVRLELPAVPVERAHLREFVLGVRLAPAAFSVAVLGGILEGAAASTIPLYAVAIGMSAAAAALLASASGFGNLIGQWPSGWLADRWGAIASTNLALAISAAAILAFAAVGAHWQPALAAMVFFGGAGGALYTLAVMEATRDAGSRVGLLPVLSAVSILYVFGALAGPAIGGFVLDQGAPVAVPLVFAALIAVIAIYHARMTH